MGTTHTMAWRNLGRNRKRSLIAGAGIALALSLCMAALGIMDGLGLDLVRSTTDGEVGHVQIHHPDYLATRQVRKTVPAAEAGLRRLRAQPGVAQAAPRLYAWGYLSHGARSGGVMLMGIAPQAEAGVTTLHRTLAHGSFVAAAPTPWHQARALSAEQAALDRELTEAAIDEAFAQIEGRREAAAPGQAARRAAQSAAIAEQLAPSPQRPPGVVLGSKLAANLGAGVGASIRLLYENTLGAQGTVDLRVAGISHSGVDAVDRSRVLLHAADLQNLLLLPEQAHEIALRVHEPRVAAAVAAALARTLAGDGAAREVLAWSQLRPDILALIASNQALMGTLVFIVFLIAGIGVLNTMLVSVMERQHELSLLAALGRSPRGVMALVLLETLWLTALACAAGLLLGFALQWLLHRWGIDVSGFGGFSMSGVGIAPVLRSSLDPANAVMPLVCMFVVTMLAAIAPAAIATRTGAARGMRTA